MTNLQTIAPANHAHPLHVILAAYPIACFTGAFVTDLAYAKTYQMQWANFSAWLIAGGVLMGLLAALAGVVDYALHRRNRQRGSASPHTLGNALALLLAVVNGFVHSRDAYTSVMPTGLALSGLVAVLVLISSWLGTTLTWAPRRGEMR